jgi:hypothetical protein
MDAWTSDPWDLVCSRQGECMLGIPLGCRILMNIAAAVEAMGGKNGPGNMVVLVHLSDHNVELALQQLSYFKFCG